MLSSPKSVSPISSFSTDNLISFYKIIAIFSNKKTENHYGLLSILRKNYVEYLQHHLLKTKIEPSTLAAKQRIMISQLTILKENNFFKEKIDLKIIERIMADIFQNGAILLDQIPEEERQDFLTEIHNIDKDCQANIVTEKTYPDVIRAGLSFQERNSLSYSSVYQTGSVSRNINSMGLEHYKNKKWEEALRSFEEAIVTEENTTSEFKREKDENAIAVYKRNIATTYQQRAVDYYEQKDFQKATDEYKKSIEILNQIPFAFKTRRDTEMMAYAQRNIALALSCIGIENYNNSFYSAAITNYQEAMSAHSKIGGFANAIDATNEIIFHRNLAYCFNLLAFHEFNINQLDLSIEHYQAAIVHFEKSANPQNDADKKSQRYCLRNLALAYNTKGIDYFIQQNHRQAHANYIHAIATINRIPTEFLTLNDQRSLAIYQNNLLSSSKLIAEQDKEAIKQFGLFKEPIDTMNHSTPIISHNPKKRKRMK